MKIVIPDAATLGPDADLSLFEKYGRTEIYGITSASDTVKRIADADIVVTNKVVLTDSVLKKCRNLKLICITATGYNNVDVEYCRENRIAVCNVAGYSTESVAQHTFAMLFALNSQTAYYDSYVKSGGYAASEVFTRLDRPFMQIRGKTWGIAGLGNIGRRVAALASAFGCRVVYYSTSGRNFSGEDYRRVDFEELMEGCDIISIHAPLNEKTENMIDYAALSLMKRNAFLLNLGRGGIVNEADLARALDENLLAGAATDVFTDEPIKEDNPLLGVTDPSKLILTPHIAWASEESREVLIEETLENISCFLEGGRKNRIV